MKLLMHICCAPCANMQYSTFPRICHLAVKT